MVARAKWHAVKDGGTASIKKDYRRVDRTTAEVWRARPTQVAATLLKPASYPCPCAGQSHVFGPSKGLNFMGLQT